MNRRETYTVRYRRDYGFFHFLLDCTLVVLTGGLWLIWILIRALVNR